MHPLIFLLAALASITPACAETGLASWYGSHEEGHKMAAGKIFHSASNNAASLRYPFGTRLIVTNLSNGRQAEVVIEDRGPYVSPRIIDLSPGTARILGLDRQGVTMVRIEPVTVVVRPAMYWHRVRPVQPPIRRARQIVTLAWPLKSASSVSLCVTAQPTPPHVSG